jgi:hypothetical protein
VPPVEDQRGRRQLRLDRPAEEGVGHLPGGVALGSPPVELGLGELGEVAVAVGQPVQQGDRNGHLLLGPQEGAVSGGVRRVTQAALVVPGDVAADGIAVRRVSRALDRLGRPDLEPAEQFVAWRQRAVLDKQATDVGLRLLPSRDLVK